ncbi:MAG: hypothetical protein Ct9H300mP16_19450 [Pseudomonadota bacterium]|nr:MAG: hypothetical protein Ct9H300mP16_19450 [Pseudomonadota bacterium]
MMVGSWAGLGALSRSTLGEVCAQPELVEMVDRAMEEGIRVGPSRGYLLNENSRKTCGAFIRDYHMTRPPR